MKNDLEGRILFPGRLDPAPFLDFDTCPYIYVKCVISVMLQAVRELKHGLQPISICRHICLSLAWEPLSCMWKSSQRIVITATQLNVAEASEKKIKQSELILKKLQRRTDEAVRIKSPTCFIMSLTYFLGEKPELLADEFLRALSIQMKRRLRVTADGFSLPSSDVNIHRKLESVVSSKNIFSLKQDLASREVLLIFGGSTIITRFL